MVAERMDLRDVIAQLLASKGWALGATGRLLEAAALLRGAVAFAQRDGLLRAEFRSRMNLSAFVQYDDVAESFETSRTGLERARQHGYDVLVYPLLANAADSALESGQWDWLHRAMDENRIEEQAGLGRASALAQLAVALAMEGDEAGADRIEAQVVEAIGGLDDPQSRTAVQVMRSRLAFARRDLEDAARQTDLLAEAEAVLQIFGGAWHIMMGLVRREPDRLRRSISDRAGGRVNVAIAAIATAGLAVLDGDRSALPEMDAALDRLDATGWRLDAALIRRSRVLLSPDDPGAAGAAALAIDVLPRRRRADDAPRPGVVHRGRRGRRRGPVRRLRRAQECGWSWWGPGSPGSRPRTRSSRPASRSSCSRRATGSAAGSGRASCRAAAWSRWARSSSSPTTR